MSWILALLIALFMVLCLVSACFLASRYPKAVGTIVLIIFFLCLLWQWHHIFVTGGF